MRHANTFLKKHPPAWDLHQFRDNAISRAAHGYSEIELKRFIGHVSPRSLEADMAHNPEAAKAEGSNVAASRHCRERSHSEDSE